MLSDDEIRRQYIPMTQFSGPTPPCLPLERSHGEAVGASRSGGGGPAPLSTSASGQGAAAWAGAKGVHHAGARVWTEDGGLHTQPQLLKPWYLIAPSNLESCPPGTVCALLTCGPFPLWSLVRAGSSLDHLVGSGF